MYAQIMPKRIFVLLATVLILILSTILSASAQTQPTKPTTPIKIGLIDPWTGPYARYGEWTEQGMRLYFDEIGWRVAGRSIQLICEDTEAKPDVALDKTRKLVEGDKVNFLAGVTSSGVKFAIRNYIHSNRIPTILCSAAGADEGITKVFSEYIFHTAFLVLLNEGALGQAAYDLGKRNAIIMAPDYAAGRSEAYVMSTGFTKAGGKVIQQVFPPLGCTDYSPYLAGLKVKEADVALVFYAGADSLRFVKQWTEYGLKPRIQLFAATYVTDDNLLDLSDEFVGVIASNYWFPELGYPANKKFVNAYKAKYNKNPTAIVNNGYIGARVIAEALNKTGGDTSDLPKLLKAIQTTSFDAPFGRFEIDAPTNSVVLPVRLIKVVKKEGKIAIEILKELGGQRFSELGPKFYPEFLKK